LLAHDISLFAYHLPLDAHPTLGNNAQLAARNGCINQGLVGGDAAHHAADLCPAFHLQAIWAIITKARGVEQAI
jgi:putative NIF3 family GTP cyclohydrolase 1 type 2